MAATLPVCADHHDQTFAGASEETGVDFNSLRRPPSSQLLETQRCAPFHQTRCAIQA